MRHPQRTLAVAVVALGPLLLAASAEAAERPAFRTSARVVNPFAVTSSRFTATRLGFPTRVAENPFAPASVFAATAEEPVTLEPVTISEAAPAPQATTTRPSFRPRVRSPFRPPPRPPF